MGGTTIFASNVLSTLISSVGTILIIRLLSPTEYGLYTISGIPLSLMAFLGDWGVNTALTKYIAQYTSEGRKESVAAVLKACFTFNLVIGVTLTGLVFALSDFLAQIVIQKPEATFVIRASCIVVLGTQLYNTCWAAFMGLTWMRLGALLQVLLSVSRVCIGVYLVLFGLREVGAVIGLGIGMITAAGIGMLALFFTVYLPSRRVPIKDLAMKVALKDVIKYGFPLAILSILTGLSNQVFSFLNARYSSTSDLGSYGVASNFTVLIGFVTFPFINVIFPTFSKLGQPEERKNLEDMFKASVKYASYLVIPVSVVVMVLSQPMVSVLFEEKYSTTPFYLILLAVGSLLCGLGSLSMTHLLLSQGKTRLVLKIGLTSTIVTIPLSILLIPSFGVTGFLVTILIMQALGTIQGIYWIKRLFGFTVWMGVSLRTYAAAAVMGATIWTATNIMNPLLGIHSPILELVIGSLTGLLSYIILLPLTSAISMADLNNIEEVLGFNRLTKPIIKILFRFMVVAKAIHNTIFTRV